MKFGVFDHLDRRDEPLGPFFRDRLAMVDAIEAAGFYSYHIAEHHSTPLGMAPSPNVYLGAVAMRTRRLRFGPLVYLLPLYHPLRLIEEICMLDQMSEGRLDAGVGRGVSPYEVGGYGVSPDKTREMFDEALEVLLNGLTHERLNHEGEYYRFSDVPMEMRPFQRPYPQLWYGGSNEQGTERAARNGMHFVTQGGNEMVRRVLTHYRDAWESLKDAPARADSPVTEPLAGVGRHIFIADSVAEAERLARPAYDYWYSSLAKLWRDHGKAPVTGMIIENYDEARRIGAALVGTPDTVRAEIAAQAAEIPFNYFVAQFAWGCLTHEQEMRSLEMFVSDVMPALA